MENHLQSTWIGIDVSKYHWDIVVAGQPQMHHWSAGQEGCQQLRQLLVQHQVTHACLEATGGCERMLVDFLREQGIAVSVVNPRQIRDFARAQGQLAKTDRLDALVIARYAVLMQPKETQKPSENEQKLRSLRTRRQQVSDALTREKNRRGTQRDEQVRQSIEEAIDFYQRQLEQLDQQIQQLIKADPQFQERSSLLVTVPGVGTTTAAALLADMPELGTLNRREVARLAGLAPINRDSGTLRGKRMIGGGRAAVRQGLYMATLVATQHNPIIREHYQQLLQRGKAKMTALTACMRKLLLILNAMIKTKTDWKCSKET
ncbi:IS110 family RNA-guided transposase [Aeoliella mucimassa]|uniref:Transposase n=1 Tax=Aeoliella mucimassa TaxID=2527972 RepID=A0A518AGM6_9BACT|nr:IS110 family transposase [Aeoliella mucimassa]QDU53839.1 Transposase [Aeoliella mucimassa]QDU56622.1 Transposase [Aeoliella mucimassa]QDU57610.1 Transposase [Aeoliella mucimassa]QDU57633.1 Transposase [Aeoliella mucimassa]QDU58922.1 Transposase [Aeoliella mucimassa]